MTGTDVLGILQGAAGTKPDASDSKRCLSCLEAFYLRLHELRDTDMEPEFLQGIKKLLPKLICKVGYCPVC